MSEHTEPNFETHKSGDEGEAPNWPKGAPQINGPQSAEESDYVKDGETEQLDEASS